MSLAELFFAKSRDKQSCRPKLTGRKHRLLLEPLEPRLLLAADFELLAPLAADLTAAPLTAVLVESATPPHASPAAVATDVSEQVQIHLGGYVLNRATNTFDTKATITNTSAETLDGPARLVLTNLTGQNGPVTLANAAGQTPEGHPFVDVPLPPEGLAPAGIVQNILLKFSNPTRGRITFTPTVQAVIRDTVPPGLIAGLAHDTGVSDTDHITMDPAITGEVSPSDLDALLAALDTDDPAKFMGVDVDPDGTFELDESFLRLLTETGTLADGAHTLHLRAADKAGNESALDLPFTLDTTPPPLSFDLAPASDSPPVGDLQTTFDIVTLQGLTEANLAVTLLETGAAAAAGPDGSWTFGGVALQVGGNLFTAEGTDVAGNQRQVKLTIIRVEAPGDMTPPAIAAALSNDTGAGDADGITTDPAIAGTVTDASAIASFLAGFGATPTVTVLADLQGAAFSFNRARLEEINGGVLVDGPHTLRLQAMDGAGNTSAFFDVAFTLDTSPPALPAFDLAPGSDSDPVGDQQTTQPVVELVGETAPGMAVELLAGQTVLAVGTSDANTGAFSFANVPLALGANPFTVRASDLAGNAADFSRTITRLPVSGEETDPPLLTVALAQDTGVSASDHLTSDPTLTGTVTDASPLQAVRAGLDGMPVESFADIVADLQPNGSFTLARARLEQILGGSLLDGPHTFNLQATDSHGNTSSLITLAFTLDTVAPQAPAFALSATSDTGTPGDNQTDAALVTLVGQTEAAATLLLVGQGAQALASGTGAFQVPAVELAPGPNVLTLRASDRAGNISEESESITRVPAAAQVDPVLEWNHVALETIRLDASPPPVASRGLAMVHAAVYDAVNALDGTPSLYVSQAAPPGASPIAAVAAAAHRVLEYLYPAQQASLDAALATTLARVPDGSAEANGVALGQSIADAIIALRSTDGWDEFVEFFGGQAPGQWRATPPMFDVPLLPQWATLDPFTLTSPDQFRPDGPPALDSQEYADAFKDVKALGRATGSTRTPQQTEIARFWADGPGTYTPPGHWNQIAESVADNHDLSLAANARLFAQLNIALADASITAWDAKYSYNFWRPITAIQEAADDGNPETETDETWQPLLLTPPFPEYVSGHSTYSAAAAAILAATFGENTPFTTQSFGLPGVNKPFQSFSQAAAEAGRSRIYGGIHFEFANQDGQAAGREVAEWVLQAFTVAADTKAPTVIVESPSPNPTVKQNFTVTGRVLDNLSGVASLQSQLDDGALAAVAFDEQGHFSVPVALPLDGTADGAHVLRLVATDVAGNVAAPVRVQFTLDTQTPIITLTSPADQGTLEVGALLEGIADGTGSPIVQLQYAFDGGTVVPVSFDLAKGEFRQFLDLSNVSAGAHTFTITAEDAAGHTSATTLALALPQAIPFRIIGHTPLDGAVDVGVTFRPQIFFSRPVSPETLTTDNFFAAGPSGLKLPATIVPADDGSFAWLFFHDPMPGAARVQVTVDGSTIRALDGRVLDADGDGTPGGVHTSDFTTVSLTPVPMTTLSGLVLDPGPDLKPMTFDDLRPGPDGALHTADDVFLNPIVGAKVFILGLEDQAVFTDPQGRFHFDAVPVGNVKVAIDGTTATNAPAGFYFPEMVMDVTLEVGQVNTLIGSMGSLEERQANADRAEVYLPRLRTAIFETVSGDAPVAIGLDPASAPGLTPEERQLLTITLDPNSLIGPNGQRLAQGEVGISLVPPELVRDMLPPGVLQHTFDITVQAPGIDRFATPAAMTFPNVFNAPPGTQLDFLSFDHTTGRLVIEGTATVSADGLSASTDPGTGITHPGWHGLTPPGSDTNQCPAPDGPSAGDVDPIPVIGELGSLRPLQDHLFFTNGEGFTLVIRNDAISDPFTTCPDETPLIVEIDVDGPTELFLDGLASTSRFALLPGQENEIQVNAKDLSAKNFGSDALFAGYVTVKGYKETAPETLLIDEKFVVARYLSVVDPESPSLNAFFRKTLTGGFNGVDFARPKNFEVHLPETVNTTFVPRGQHAALFDLGPPVKGEDPIHAWKFNPTAAGRFSADVEIIVGDRVLPQKLNVEGTAVDPVVIEMISGFQDALKRYLQDPRHFDGTQGVVQASIPFTNEFTGVLPGDNPSAEDLNAAVSDAAFDLGGEVFSDFIDVAPASGPGGPDAISVTPQPFGGLQILVEWVPELLDSSGRKIYGQADILDADKDKLKDNMSDPDLPDAAKHYVFGESLNLQLQHTVKVALDLHTTFGGNTLFATLVANTVSHEIGHVFGLLEAYHKDGGNVTNVDPPNDIMRARSDADGDLEFADANLATLKAALGVGVADQSELNHAIALYRKNFNLPTSTQGFAENTDPPNPIPVVGLKFGADSLFNGDHLDGGIVPADGPGGKEAVRTLRLTNTGLAPLTLNAVELTNGTVGWSIRGVDLAGRGLNIGESVAFDLVFNPLSEGQAADSLKILSNTGTDFELFLDGKGLTTAGRIAVDLRNDQNNLGGLRLSDAPKIAEDVATIRNIGGGPLTITDIRPDNENIGQFRVAELPVGFGPANPLVLAPGEAFLIDLVFDAKAIGLQRGRLRIFSDDPETPVFSQPVVGTGLADTGSALRYGNDFVAVETHFLSNSPTLRQISDNKGNWNFFLPPEAAIHYVTFDPESGLVAEGFDTTEVAGRRTSLSPPVFVASTAPDTDGDGLPDDVEFAVGTASGRADTDGDGLDDFVELQQGLDPFGGRGLPLGIIAGLEVSPPREIVVEDNIAYLATSDGLSLVDVTQVAKPRLLGQLDLPAPGITDVAVDPSLGIAGAAGPAGLFLVDVSDPTAPVLRKALTEPGATEVEIVEGVAYVMGLPPWPRAVDLLTGDVLQEQPFFSLSHLVREGTRLYGFNGETFHVVETAGPVGARSVGALDLSATVMGKVRLRDLFVGNGVAYVTTGSTGGFGFGLITVDVSDPARPILLSGPDVDLRAQAIALNGSGVAVINTLSANPDGGHALNIFDVSEPRATDRFRFAVDSGLQPDGTAALALFSGVGLVPSLPFLGMPAGLAVVNYSPPDVQGQPPRVSLRAPLDDVDPQTPGLQILEGTTIRVQAEVVDDVQVRNVELLLNGEVIRNDVSFPWDSFALAPTIATSAPTIRLELRATDMGGNAALSDPLAITLVPESTPPTIALVVPADGTAGLEGLQRIGIRFSEPMAVQTLTGQTLQLVGSSGGPLVPLNIQFREDDRFVQLTYAPLPAGQYELRIDAPAVTDRAGNPLGTAGLTRRFTLQRPGAAGDLFPDRVYLTGLEPVSLATGDLDGDAALDAVTADLTNFGLSVFLGRSDGTLGARTAILPGGAALNGPNAVALGDVNNDGHLDIIATNSFPTGLGVHVALFLGRGDGTFADPTGYALPLSGFGAAPRALALGDVDRDGLLDIVTANSDNSATVLFNTGTSTPPPPGGGGPPGEGPPGESPGGGRVRSLDDGRFANPIQLPVGVAPVAVAVHDLDRDGDLDIVTANRGGNSVSVLLGTGTGAFGPMTQMFTVVEPVALGVGDVNRDGIPDLVVAGAESAGDRRNQVLAHLGRGNGTFAFGGIQDLGSIAPRALGLGDTDRDGDLDLVLGAVGALSGGELRVLAGNADGTFGAPTGFNAGGEPVAVALADMDRNGSLDVLAVNQTSNTLALLLNDGAGRLGAPDRPVGGIPRSMALGDVNGDSRLDLVFGKRSLMAGKTTLSVLLGAAGGTFARQIDQDFALHPDAPLVLRDLNGDGRLDLIAQSVDPTVDPSSSIGLSVSLGVGDGTFGAPTTYPDAGGRHFAVGDIDRDGELDILVETGMALFGVGDGTFKGPVQYQLDPAFSGHLLVDVDRDGDLDILAELNMIGTSVFSATLEVVLQSNERRDEGRIALDASTGTLVIVGTDFDDRVDIHLDKTVSPIEVVAALTWVDAGGMPHVVTRRVSNPVSSVNATIFRTGFGIDEVVVDVDPQLVPPSRFTPRRVGPFEPPKTYPVGNGFGDFTLGDVDNDGDPDVVAVSSSSITVHGFDEVAVILNDGTGAFGNRTDYPAGGRLNLTSVSLGDVNGDRNLDILTTSFQSVTIWLGAGDGTFPDRRDYVVGNGAQRLALGDLDGDGDVDFVTNSGSRNAVSPRLNRSIEGQPLLANTETVGDIAAEAAERLTPSRLEPLVANRGTIAAGAGSLVDLGGSLAQDPSGTVSIEIAGRSTSEVGQVRAGGGTMLAGTLNVSLVGGFTPAPGDAFDVITFPSHSGTFDALTLPPGLHAAVEATRVRVTAVAPAGPTSVEPDPLGGVSAAPPDDAAITLAPPRLPRALAHEPFSAAATPSVTSLDSISPAGKSLIAWNGGVAGSATGNLAHREDAAHVAWLRDFLLELAQDDPNRDLRVELPVAVPA